MSGATTNGLASVLAKVAFHNPEALRLAAQLLGVPPCPKCDHIKTHCKCPKEENMNMRDVMVNPRAMPSDPDPVVVGSKRFLVTYFDYQGEFQVQAVMALNLKHALDQFTTMAVKIAETLKTTTNYELYSITRAS